jgi:hypothetical protein
MTIPATLGPSTRIGQCGVYDVDRDAFYMAYGVTPKGTHLNDFWRLDLLTHTWRLVARKLLSPRAYPSAVLVGRLMYIFGGALDGDFYSDLHAVNVDTGEIIAVNHTGNSLCERTSPLMIARSGFLYIWGGYNGTAQRELVRLPIGGGEAQKFPEHHTGLSAPAYCCHNGTTYVFGGATGTGMSILDPEAGSLIPMPCIGTEPCEDLSRPSLVSADEFIFLIGGDAPAKHMHLFALDVKRRWWFAFHVRPDGETLTTADGHVSKSGLFMLPREHSASVFYSPKERELVSVMGSRLDDPPPVFKIAIGEALAVLHARSDLLEAFLATSKPDVL